MAEAEAEADVKMNDALCAEVEQECAQLAAYNGLGIMAEATAKDKPKAQV